jgi:hypothetical protein
MYLINAFSIRDYLSLAVLISVCAANLKSEAVKILIIWVFYHVETP